MHPRDKTELQSHLEALGVNQGDTLFVHSSFKSLGPVAGAGRHRGRSPAGRRRSRGPPAHALLPPDPKRETTGRGSGTMPRRPPPWGGSPSTSACLPDTHRSDHYSHSVAARGPGAAEFVAGHLSQEGPPSSWDRLPWGRTYGTPFAHEPRLPAGRKAAHARRRLRDLHLHPFRGGPLLGPPAAKGPARPPAAPGPPRSGGLVGRPRAAGPGAGGATRRPACSPSTPTSTPCWPRSSPRPAATWLRRDERPSARPHPGLPPRLPGRRAGAGPGGRRRRHPRRGGVPAPDALRG